MLGVEIPAKSGFHVLLASPKAATVTVRTKSQ
jgi:hypothetical protein